MKIYESNLSIKETIEIIHSLSSEKDGDIEVAINGNKIVISVKHLFKRKNFSRLNVIKIPPVFYGEFSQRSFYTILSGAFEIASAWKVACIIFTFALVFSASVLLGDLLSHEITFTKKMQNQLFSYYFIAACWFATIPVLRFFGKIDEEKILSFLKKELGFKLKKEIFQFSRLDIVYMISLGIAHIIGFLFALIS